ncbi:hypothetical protein GCM10011273_27070 [Asticcacaulis endophyticus]|uniref:Uncharacterized protein n=1 Tax=Asticcacaulis endophyticus TaxID=1395890 RepID=A0A918UWN3_9CAUL|nr:hypothetical protein GCM10011273_27070 [Asticcacaulis endophyticus]
MTQNKLKTDPHLTISLTDLQIAWAMLANPDRSSEIPNIISAVETLIGVEGPSKAAFTVIAATAWLTSEGETSSRGWQA